MALKVPNKGFWDMSGKNIFASKINLILVTKDVLNFFGGPCTKNQIFSLNEELEGSKFGSKSRLDL